MVIFTAIITLSMLENFPLHDILFEAASAFGTVGLSTGITSFLTKGGKLIIILLMFLGRTGPLTALAAISEKPKAVNVSYPQARISIG